MVHLDTDVLIWACSRPGPERDRLFAVLDGGERVGMSAWAWYEFNRGPRTPEQIATASVLVDPRDVVPVSVDIAERSAEVFRSLGSPRTRAADILIGVTASVVGARLLTRNARDFAGLPDLELEVITDPS